MQSFETHSLEETRAIAAQWLKDVSDAYKGSSRALVVGLSGHLGAGKTAFVKQVAKTLGIREEVTSPTFVIMKSYDLPTDTKLLFPWKRLVHIDAYRLEKAEELGALDYDGLIADPGNLAMIEWPENVSLKGFQPKCRLTFEIRGQAHVIGVE